MTGIRIAMALHINGPEPVLQQEGVVDRCLEDLESCLVWSCWYVCWWQGIPCVENIVRERASSAVAGVPWQRQDRLLGVP